MSNYTDVNTIRNGLVALQVLALSNADEYLENLAEKGLEALERLSAAQQSVQLTAAGVESGGENSESGGN
jgi:hypothetical protein